MPPQEDRGKEYTETRTAEPQNVECRRKEHTKKRTVEPQNRRISNVEGRYSVYFIKSPLPPLEKGGKQVWNFSHTVHFIKKTERSDTTLRHSAVRHSTFYGSLFPRFCGSLFVPYALCSMRSAKAFPLRAGINRRPYDKIRLRHFLFSAFRIPTSEFLTCHTPGITVLQNLHLFPARLSVGMKYPRRSISSFLQWWQ